MASLTIKTTVQLAYPLALDVQLLSARKMILQIAFLALLGTTYLPVTVEAYKRVSTRTNQVKCMCDVYLHLCRSR